MRWEEGGGLDELQCLFFSFFSFFFLPTPPRYLLTCSHSTDWPDELTNCYFLYQKYLPLFCGLAGNRTGLVVVVVPLSSEDRYLGRYEGGEGGGADDDERRRRMVSIKSCMGKQIDAIFLILQFYNNDQLADGRGGRWR